MKLWSAFAVISFPILLVGAGWREGAISKNVDGDTVWIDEEGERIKIRIHGIDAPEMAQGDWGQRSARFLEAHFPLETRVRVRDDGKDKYGRTLGHVYHDDENLELTMLEAGWAIPYIFCSGKACNRQFFEQENVQELVQTCERARDAGKGVFDPQNPLDEMPFEYRLRTQDREPDKLVGDYVTKQYFAPDEYERVDVCRRIFFSSAAGAERSGYSRNNRRNQAVLNQF